MTVVLCEYQQKPTLKYQRRHCNKNGACASFVCMCVCCSKNISSSQHIPSFSGIG